jgi:hypothetical protein
MPTVGAILLALCLQDPGSDVIVLKDKTTRSGMIAAENPSEVILENMLLGLKGQVIGTARVSIPKGEISRIDRTSDEIRRKALERARSFGERAKRRAEALSRIVPVPTEIDGAKGFRIAGASFELVSTCEETLVKDVGLCLGEIFSAYRKFFEVTRNGDRKLKVYFFASRAEFDRFQEKMYGGVVLNPAFFDPKRNHIAAFDCVQKDEARRIRLEILEAERALQGLQVDLQAEESRVAGVARQFRSKILEEAAARKEEVLDDGAGNKDGRLRDVDKWKDEKLDDLKKVEQDLTRQLEEFRKKAGEEAAKYRKVVERNKRVLVAQSNAMYEGLFHEAFHAFAANYLWEGSERKEFPRWLHEGMACYFEKSAVEGDELVHGAPHAQFLESCRYRMPAHGLLPVESILKAGGDRYSISHATEIGRAGLYYAQSWALVHYLSTRVTREQLAAYVTGVLSGKDGVAQFEAMVGKSCAQVDEDLQQYLKQLK